MPIHSNSETVQEILGSDRKSFPRVSRKRGASAEESKGARMTRGGAVMLMAIFLALFLPFFASTGRSAVENAVRSDDWIVATSKFLMEQDGKLDPMKVQVESNGGKVVLKGVVKTDYERARAEHIVTTVPGVKSVENEVIVTASEDKDEKLEKEVRAGLLGAPALNLLGFSVKVEDGVTHLYGIARDPKQKRLAEKMARMVPGVQKVDNEIVVVRRPV